MRDFEPLPTPLPLPDWGDKRKGEPMTTTHTEIVGQIRVDGSIVTQADVAYGAVLDEVTAVVGVELAGRLEDAIIDRLREARDAAIRQQCAVIRGALLGDLTAWPGCMPQWSDRPLGS
jgi:hypothetical protein